MKRIHSILLAIALVACQSSSDNPREIASMREAGATLGVTTTVPSKELAGEMGLPFQVRQQGRVVESVTEASPASRSGIEPGDVLVQLGGVTLYSQDDIDDFLSVHEPGAEVRATLVRKGTRDRQEVRITLGAGAAPPSDSIRWQYASLAQLPAALVQARAEKKKVLVGLSGAETWWPSTRFEGGALSSILNDPAVVRATEAYVRVIVRRPHASFFLNETFAEEGGVASATPAGGVTGKGTELPLPGFYIVDSEGRFIAATTIQSVDEVLEMLGDGEALDDFTSEAQPPTSEIVSIRVSGFTAAEGITWHGWPNGVQEALYGLHGVREIEVDLADDRFDVTFDPSLIAVADFLRTIRDLEYEPEIVDAPTEQVVLADRIDPASLPEGLRGRFAEARAEDKLVLVEFSGPGWVSCVQMDAVTYPHPDVKRELSHWIETRIDVVDEPEVVAAFAVAAIPTAVLLDGDGRIHDRVVGFLEPAAFLERLRKADQNR